MTSWFLVAIGGFFGAISRFYVGNVAKKRFATDFPTGTIAVNLLGSFLLGYLFAAPFEKGIYTFFGVGFLGAFTTFSTMSVEAIQLLFAKKFSISIIYLALTYILGILLAFLGYFIGYK
ncbi:fluoride efflux transporter CrcB [Robertmurraya kyonggiensis]|uniref:Fluoride-specific ion channel FluC n=1 Tax=Robertmurraya kyonggiensis TaxID=1037680 RepID=A0A4U1DA30_9BACI|nr:fluoride efflux transporter CrcB [Robertmurraya kyonggiensis]TKC19372.1 fluoride efflux transporter CrcB [Robertmurraya kyonggiensis]